MPRLNLSKEDANHILELLCTHEDANIELAKQLYLGAGGRADYQRDDFFFDYFFAWIGGFRGKATKRFEKFDHFKDCSYKRELYELWTSYDTYFPKHNPNCFLQLDVHGASFHKMHKIIGVENTSFSWLVFRGEFKGDILPDFGKNPLPNIKHVSFEYQIENAPKLINKLPIMPNLESITYRAPQKFDDRFNNVQFKYC